MTLNNKEIYLSLLPKYELVANEFVESSIFKNKIKYNKDFIEIKISMDDENESKRLDVVKEITSFLMKVMKENILKEYIHKTYSEIYKEQEFSIYDKSLEIFDKKDVLMRESIFNKLNNYISNNNRIDIFK